MKIELKKGHIMPDIRIQKIVLDNFKSIRHGRLILNCGKKDDSEGTEADITGIYGQNGSGKTSIIEALAILKSVMSGDPVPAKYSECVTDGAEYSRLAFMFEFRYPDVNPFTRTVQYSFKMEAVANEINDDKDVRFRAASYPKKVRIFDEVISASGLFSGTSQKMQEILTTRSNVYPIGPTRKVWQYVGDDRERLLVDLVVNKRTADRNSTSFVFMEETLELFKKHSNYSEYVQVLLELNAYAIMYLYAIDSRVYGFDNSLSVPLYTRYGAFRMDLLNSTRIPQKAFKYLEDYISSVNTVLPTLVAGLTLEVSSIDIMREGEPGKELKLYSRRQKMLLPLRDESAGIIKLVGILLLIIDAFNDSSLTVAIDEMDAGIFEYLLGEILTALETYGKGQFIFTSHNLRPLEVLKKESIVFTTSNPDNRYIRLKGVGRTNNLRNLYLREILANSQDEPIYDAAKRQRMIAAFIKAGVGLDEKE